MLICENCGVDNPLGRVFCIGCGGKLNLENMTSDQVEESQKQSWIVMHWPKLVALFVVFLLVMVGVAFWSQTSVIGNPGKPNDARRVSSDLRAIASMTKGSKVFEEKNVNGYFEYRAKKSLKGALVSIDVHEGWFSVRVIRSFGKLNLSFVNIPLRLSFDLKCIPIGGVVHVGSASMGHIKMIGPFKTIAIKQAYGTIASLKDWSNLKNITKLEMSDDKITVTVKK